jgi:hypothetical protein
MSYNPVVVGWADTLINTPVARDPNPFVKQRLRELFYKRPATTWEILEDGYGMSPRQAREWTDANT